MSCIHCSASAHGLKREVLDVRLLAAGIRLAAEVGPPRTFELVLAGGEPTLAGPDWLRQAILQTRNVLEELGHGLAKITLNTNLLDVPIEIEEWIRREGVDVVCSLDGPPALADPLRGPTTARVADNARNLITSGIAVRNVCVVTPFNANEMDEVLDFLDEVGITVSKFNPLSLFGRAGRSQIQHLDPGLFAAAKTRVLDRMLAGSTTVQDPELRWTVERFLKRSVGIRPEQFRSCYTKYCGYGHTVMAISPEGDISGCGYGTNLSDKHQFGHADRGLVSDWASRRDQLLARGPRWAECDACPAAAICTFGCNALNVEDAAFNECSCNATKIIWEALLDREESLSSWFESVVEEGSIRSIKASRLITGLQTAASSIGATLDPRDGLALNLDGVRSRVRLSSAGG